MAETGADMRARKAALRRAMAARREALPVEARSAASAALAGHAERLAGLLRPGEAAAGFIALRSEIDPGPLLAALAARSVPLALPRVEAEGLSFRAWQPGDILADGPFGLSEPAISAHPVTPALVLVPLLAFDRAGGRLGYGKGYYDRALAALRPRFALGLAHACQEVEAVPAEPHDRPLDGVLTGSGWIDCLPPPRD